MRIKEILTLTFNYTEYIVTDGDCDIICLCLSVSLSNNEVPAKNMEIEMIYPFTFNAINIEINNDKKDFLIQKSNSHFGYNLRGEIINKEKALVKVENFVICLVKDFGNGFNNQYQIGDFILFYYREKSLFVIHRIVSIFDNKYSLMGNNAYSLEKNIYFEDIVRKVCCKIVKGNNVYIRDSCSKFISKINIKELYLFS